MACTRWEETGLLYTSGELSASEREAYGRHLQECPECLQEMEAYEADRKEFFSIEMLGEQPAAAVDAEIVRVCGKRYYAGMRLLAAWAAKPAVAALFFLALGAGGGFYVAYQMESGPQLAPMAAQQAPAASPLPSTTVAAAASAGDSLDADSAAERRPLAAQPAASGVVPVNLQQK